MSSRRRRRIGSGGSLVRRPITTGTDPEDGESEAAIQPVVCERRLKSAARGGRKVQRWGWVESTLG
jgi:hypothetical protein